MSATVPAAASYDPKNITGVVLAGGRATRMGGLDKGLIPLKGKPMISHVISALRQQVGDILINANRNQEQYAKFGYPVIPDMMGEFFGPLAGMASAMRVAETEYILTVPCDAPLISTDLAKRLFEVLVQQDADMSVAHDGHRMQPVFALLRRDLLGSLLAYLESGERKIDRWFVKHSPAVGRFTDRAAMFINVNSPDDCTALEAKLSEIK